MVFQGYHFHEPATSNRTVVHNVYVEWYTAYIQAHFKRTMVHSLHDIISRTGDRRLRLQITEWRFRKAITYYIGQRGQTDHRMACNLQSDSISPDYHVEDNQSLVTNHALEIELVVIHKTDKRSKYLPLGGTF